MKIHGHSLNNEPFLTLMKEVEVTLNPRQLTVERFNDACSYRPSSLADLLTVKSNVFLPPPGQFQKAYTYCHKLWQKSAISRKLVLVLLEKWCCT